MKRVRVDDLGIGESEVDIPILVDFDHTLFSSNSTELFIASSKPSFVAATVDFLIRDCIPWKHIGIPNAFRFRDYICCLLILIISPWNFIIWKRIAPDLFQKYECTNLTNQLRNAKQVWIVSFGMRFIIRSLLRNSAFQRTTLIATPLFATPRYFSRGKLDIILSALPEVTVSSSIAVSDSLDDSDLLSAARAGLLVEPQGQPFLAAHHLYFPLRYTTRAKYPLFYTIDQLLFVDFLLAVCATSFGFGALWRALLIVPFFLTSLMCIYEMGYFENDTVAALREAKPSLSEKVGQFCAYPIRHNSWMWAAALGLAGSTLAYKLGVCSSVAVPMMVWMTALAAIRTTFFVYNRRPAASRISLYAVLQLEKYSAIFLIIPPTLPGSVLALSQIATMSMIYVLYRLGGNKKLFDRELFRLTLFASGICILVATRQIEFRANLFAFVAIVVWFALRFATTIIKDSSVVRLLRPQSSS